MSDMTPDDFDSGEHDECEHGSLARSCEICERDAEIERLRARVEELERGFFRPDCPTKEERRLARELEAQGRLIADEHAEVMRLRAELAELRDYATCYVENNEALQDDNAALRARVEELESFDILEDIEAFQHAHGVYEITTEQIDKAWALLQKYKHSPEFRDSLVWQVLGNILGLFGITACGCADPMYCPRCKDHGWKIGGDDE